ncbi:MAG: 3-oxoacyl-acyl-carrier-protein synthase [Planctomycetota bacterium]|nr:MAG: 3-oxoacyl-acyl-carrier-protein synthase [Planctomycetota bacterium]
MTPLLKVGIAGTGSYVPEKVMTNGDYAKFLDTSDEWIRERTGIRERRFAPDGMATSHMAENAAKKAMEAAKVAPEDIDLVICGTVTPDNMFPSTACHLQHRLGCVKAGAFDLSAACTGFIYSLSVGWNMVRTGSVRNVLVIGAEKLSTLLNMQDRTSCILFGDGAGAAVVRPSENASEILFSSLHSLGGTEDIMSLPAGGSAMPASHSSVDGKHHYLRIKGREVFKFAVTKMVEQVELCAEKCGVPVSKIATIIPHQVNLRILEYASEKLNFPLDRMMINIDRYGNTSAASVPIALDEAVRSGRVKRGDLVVMVAFGAGLTWGSVAVRY